MKNRYLAAASIVVFLVTLALVTPAGRVMAQTAANYFTWGYSNDSSVAKEDQGGAIELGQGSSGTGANPVSEGQPYIDFHYGNGESQDYNYRIFNRGDQYLAFESASGNLPLQLEPAEIQVNGGVDAGGSGIKHVRTAATCSTGSSAFDTCNIVVTWPGTPFADANYTATCNIKTFTGNGTGGAVYGFTLLILDANKLPGSMTVVVQNTIDNGPLTVDGLNCIAIHD